MKASTFVISITPFDVDGQLDELALRDHLDRMADAGVGVYLGGGGSGEGFTFTTDEARRVLEIGVDQIDGRVPLRAMGIEPRTAQQMIDYITMAADVGVDAVQVYSLDPGHGHRPTPREIELYLATVLDSTSLPCVVSSHQSVGYLLEPKLLASLEVVRISRMLYGNGGIRATKAVMNRLGLACGSVRPPQLDADDATVDLILLDLQATDAPTIERW
jgi:4-hydroxy-tetrahydrodipicolinate synthase